MKRLYILIIIFVLVSSFTFANNNSALIVNGNQTLSITCGDSICSVGENVRNCLLDCSPSSFSARLETDDIILGQEGFTQSLYIDSYRDSLYTISSDIPILNFSFERIQLNRGSSGTILVTAVYPENEVKEEYIGSITVSNAFGKTVIPVQITSTSRLRQFANINLQVLESQIFSHEDVHFRIYTNIYEQEITPDMKLDVLIKRQDSNISAVVKSYNVTDKTMELFDSFSLTHEDIFGERHLLFNPSLRGDYEVTLSLSHSLEVVQTTRLLSVEESFFRSLYFRIPLAVIIGLPLIYFLFRGFHHFRDYRRSKKRYVAPAFHLLPKEKHGEQLLEVGKIADTKRNAFMIASDLTTHALVAGSTGSGKSVTASVIVEEALNKKIPAVIFDPTAQWTGFLSPLKDPNIFKYYEKFGLTPDDAKSYKGLIFTPKDDEFDLTFDDYMNPGEVTVFNLSSLTTKQYDKAVKKIIDKMFAKQWEESPDLQLVVIFDEVHRLLDKSTEGLGYAALTKACREFRKWGIGLVMASQVSSDFKEAIGGNVLTEVQLNTKNLEDINKVGKKYGPDFAKRVTRQGIGVALVQNPKYNKGKPWFVNFRPPLHNPHKLSEEELHTYEEYTVKLLAIRKKIDALKDKSEREDIMMDYNLAYNKLKEGKFKMAEIYIQGLQDRVK